MRFCIFILCFFSFIFSQNLDVKNNQIKNIFKIDEILRLNYKLKHETNSTKITQINLQKNKNFAQIPQNIIDQKIDEVKLENYIKDKTKYENLAKFGNLEAKSKLKFMELQEIFYISMFELENQFIKGATSKDIEKKLIENLSKIESIEPVKNMTNLDEFDANKMAFIEILNFLINSSENLGDSSIFTFLNLSYWINKINSIFDFSYINIGKIVIILFVTIFFYIFRKILALAVYKILQFFSGNYEERVDVIKILIFPMGILLLAYSFNICVDIAFYPLPTSKIFIDFFKIFYIFIFSWIIIKILDCYSIILIDKINIKKHYRDILNLATKFLHIVVVIVTILMILSKLGFNTSAIVASFGIGGLAIAFASKDIIANFFASVMMIFDNSFYQGDKIKFNGIEGTIVETGLRKTSIRTSDNSLIFIPNSKLIDGVITNISRKKVGNLITLFLRLDYSTKKSKIELIIKKIENMLLNDENIIAQKKSSEKRKFYVSVDDLIGYKSGVDVYLNDFGEKGMIIKISCYTKTIISKEFDGIKQEIMLKILEILEENNIKFAPNTASEI